MLAHRQHHIRLKHIQALCTLLHCTPNDLFAWTPDNPSEDHPANPLQAIRKKNLPTLRDVVGKMTLSEVNEKPGGAKAETNSMKTEIGKE